MILSEIKKAHPDWNVVLMSDDMEEEINCACCGKKFEFGFSYTSFKQLTDNKALGLPVCLECYKKELERLED